MTPAASRRAALRATLALAGMVALGLPVSGVRAQDPASAEAVQAARDWLALADANDADAAYREAGTKYRATLDVERWREALKLVREPLGAATQRTLAGSQLASKLQGVPDGDYAQVMFRTSWVNKPVGREYLTLEREAGRWRVIGYVVQ